jgi:integrase
LNDPIANASVQRLKRKDVKDYINRRMKESWQGPPTKRWKKPSHRTPVVTTIDREIAVMRKAFELLRDQHDHLVNPFSKVGSIEGKQHSRTTRCLEDGELERLLEASSRVCSKLNRIYIPLAMIIAYETGMRRKEIMNLRREDINDPGNSPYSTITIRESKTDHLSEDGTYGRVIPLTTAVEFIIDKLETIVGELKPKDKLFGKLTATALSQSFCHVMKEAKLDKRITLHEFRNTAITRFDKILSNTENRWMVGHSAKDAHEGYKKPTRDDIKIMRARLGAGCFDDTIWRDVDILFNKDVDMIEFVRMINAKRKKILATSKQEILSSNL